jgi:hypothetical protein
VQCREDAIVIIYNSGSHQVRVHINDIDDPSQMWSVLAEHLDKVNTAVG